jgi:hypothetical protein
MIDRRMDSLQSKLQSWFREFKQLTKDAMHFHVKYAFGKVFDKKFELQWVNFGAEDRVLVED